MFVQLIEYHVRSRISLELFEKILDIALEVQPVVAEPHSPSIVIGGNDSSGSATGVAPASVVSLERPRPAEIHRSRFAEGETRAKTHLIIEVITCVLLDDGSVDFGD
ncbi:hypothetical protein C477_00405 [Haloterrigena salina JCM 13891]|uniref:Uncharacterized protein n=1 Tax=Haloterrigena salina JCM 13891 TaxID=1227488 RepID=M0CMY9_9EURY|nr:hypothetical protein C477_00405 [Haloterrigena salina JCM 13891]